MVAPELNISVLVRTFNSGGTLRALLSKLDLREGDEVLLIDSGSTDSTAAIAKEVGAHFIKAEGPFNYSKSLNIGFSAAKNSLVYVVSSHHIPSEDNTLTTLRALIADLPSNLVVLYGPSLPWGGTVDWLPKEKVSCFSDDSGVGICTNANSLYRRSAWEKVPFDEGVRTGEDRVWLYAILKKRYQYAFAPMIAGKNRNKGSLVYMFKKGRSDARALRSESHRPMQLWHLGGAIKNRIVNFLRGHLDFAGLMRCIAHTVGAFIGSHESENNTP